MFRLLCLMLGLKRVLAPPPNAILLSAAAEPIMSYPYSDSDGEMSVQTEVTLTYPEGFVALIVSGPNAVKQFETDYPSLYSRCLLAKRIDRGHRFTQPVPYSVTLHEFPNWRVGAGFDSFMRELIPPSSLPHHCAYNVSEWDSFDYYETESPPNSNATTTASSPKSAWTYDPDQPSTPPLRKKNRHGSALNSLSKSGFDCSPVRALLHHRGPWQRMISQQCSPEQKSQLNTSSSIPAPPTLQLASDSSQSIFQ